MPRPAVAPRVGGDPFAPMEHLDRAGRGAGVHLLADQGVRHRVEEALALDMIVDADAGEMPLGILVILLRQRLHDGAFDGLEQLAAAHAQAAHLAAVHPLHGAGDGGVVRCALSRDALGEREERHVAQPAEDVGLREPHPRFDGRLVPRAPRPGGTSKGSVSEADGKLVEGGRMPML